jgi:hypothetical protein
MEVGGLRGIGYIFLAMNLIDSFARHQFPPLEEGCLLRCGYRIDTQKESK